MNNTVTARNLSFRFAEKQILNGLSFQIREGEIFGLLGPSGAGKTTLIKVLTGQLRQTGGYAELLGRDTRMLGRTERRQIGTMMDTFGLYDRLSVYDNLAFYADIFRVSHSVIPDILKRIGLHEARRTAVSKLSRGMKSRLALARALMNNARILFLDEPTSGLDPATAGEIHAILQAQRRKGTTIFLTTHNMAEASKLCAHIALLNSGSIIESGEPAEICRKYNHLNRLRITLKNGHTVLLENGRSSAGRVKEYLESESIEAIHSTEPTLETVFIELTGRGLNEYESGFRNSEKAAERHSEK